MTHAIVVTAFGGPEQLQWQDRPELPPGAGELSIQTRMTGVNFADILARRGGYGPGPQPPFTPGLDAVGVVEALGAGVSGFTVGQRVAAFTLGGSYATLVNSKAALVYPVPDGVSDESAAALTMLVTAYNLLRLAGRLQPGETVLVHAAAGGVGSLAVQMARLLGAGRVIGTAGSAEKCQFVQELGAEAVYSRDEDFAARVNDLTDGHGADLILDAVGGETTERGLSCLAPFGRLMVYGGTAGQGASVSTPLLHRTNRAVIGYSSGHYRQHRPEAIRPAVEATFGMLTSGQLRVHIGARFPLQQAGMAQALVEGRQSTGKVLLVP